MRVLLVRHTETDLAYAGRCIGQTDIPLSETGTSDVLGVVEQLKAFAPELVAGSDLTRCALLAPVLAADCRVPCQLHAGLREVDFGAWEGRSWDEVRAEDPVFFESWTQNFVEVSPPSGESLSQLARRAESVLNTLAEQGWSRAIIISHAGPIRALLCRVQGWSLDRAFEIPFSYGESREVDWQRK